MSRLEGYKIAHYFTDYFNAYGTLLPANKHIIGKSHTHLIESNNARQRDYFARFKRRTKAFTRSFRMLAVTMILFQHVIEGYFWGYLKSLVK